MQAEIKLTSYDQIWQLCIAYVNTCIKRELKKWFINLLHGIKVWGFYHSTDQISPHHHKKLGPAPLTVITVGWDRLDISQFEKYFAESE